MNDQTNPALPEQNEEKKPAVDVSRLIPVFEDMMLMLHESLTKIPHASSNLLNVTKRNELVTTEVLSIVDRLGVNVEKLTAGLEKITAVEQQRKDLRAKIGVALQAMKGNGAGNLLPLWNELEALPPADIDIPDLMKDLKTVQEDSTSIIMSLQVQDITAQHIVAVNHLIESVQNRLTIILQKFYGADFQAMIPDSTRQRLANYVSRLSKKVHTQDILADNPTESQDAIDKLFKEF